MIITRTPFRISFFGGGTDYPIHYRRHGGAVLATAINHFCRISLRRLPPFFAHRFRVVYSRVEEVREIDEIRHPAVKACLQYFGITEGLEIHHDGDLPARSGLGSSSSFTVGLLAALHAFQGRMIGHEELARQAIHVEQDLIGENVGSQDQITVACGGVNIVRFYPAGDGRDFSLQPLCMDRERSRLFNSHLMLFFTGIFRNASEVAKEQIEGIGAKTRELKRLEAMVDEAADIVCGTHDITSFGELLHEGWLLKKEMSGRISSDVIDDIYKRARLAGAIGGKLLGAGGGGFMLFFVRPENHVRMKKALGLLHVPFTFNHEGSQILYYSPETSSL